MLTDALAAAALLAVTASILLPLARSGQLRRNRLDLGAALVFLACGVGHALHALAGAGSGGWPLSLWAATTAVVALGYLRLRRVAGPPEEGGGLYEDARRRQHELAGQAMAANVREELAVEREAAAEQRFARIFTSSPVGMALVDRRGIVTRANPTLSRIVGQDVGAPGVPETHLAEVLGHDRDDVDALLARVADAVDGFEIQIERTDGDLVWGRLTITPLADDDGSLLIQVEDATERRQAEERLEHMSMHDRLSGLPNRLLFHNRAAAALRQANRTGCYVGCLMVDLDHFKLVNESLGHTAGDQLLTVVAERLTKVVRPGDTLARMGGDEFGLLVVGLEHQAEAEVVARRVRAELDGVVDLLGTQVATSASIGVSVALPGDRTTSETLVRDADIALSQAKADGRSSTVVFELELRDDVLRRLHEGIEPESAEVAR